MEVKLPLSLSLSPSAWVCVCWCVCLWSYHGWGLLDINPRKGLILILSIKAVQRIFFILFFIFFFGLLWPVATLSLTEEKKKRIEYVSIWISIYLCIWLWFNIDKYTPVTSLAAQLSLVIRGIAS